MPHPSWLLPLLLAALGAGCAPSLHLRVREPAPTNLHSARQLSLLQLDGAPDIQKSLRVELSAQTRDDGWFTWKDRTSENLYDDGPQPLGDGELGLRLQVLHWNLEWKKETYTQEVNGKQVQKERTRGCKYSMEVRADIFDARGRALLVGGLYKNTGDWDTDFFCHTSVSRGAVWQLLHQITPPVSSHYVRLDDEDPAQRPMLLLARKGQVERALLELEAYAERHPERTSAQYNLAVMLDALGQHPEALELYDRALSASPKDFYAEMRLWCSRRMNTQASLGK